MTAVDNPDNLIVTLQRYIIHSKFPFFKNHISKFRTKTLKSKFNNLTLHNKSGTKKFMDG